MRAQLGQPRLGAHGRPSCRDGPAGFRGSGPARVMDGFRLHSICGADMHVQTIQRSVSINISHHEPTRRHRTHQSLRESRTRGRGRLARLLSYRKVDDCRMTKKCFLIQVVPSSLFGFHPIRITNSIASGIQRDVSVPQGPSGRPSDRKHRGTGPPRDGYLRTGSAPARYCGLEVLWQ